MVKVQSFLPFLGLPSGTHCPCGKIPHWMFDMLMLEDVANAMNNAIQSPLFNHCSWPKAYINLENPMNI